jgi:hypothetical protein
MIFAVGSGIVAIPTHSMKTAVSWAAHPVVVRATEESAKKGSAIHVTLCPESLAQMP